ncbi:MAG: aminotransferase class III-fold pyridoxal phosphate-dependent enzyme [Caldiserica bacterium]|nr:aminotransferase class III-fold pyridoxal phosphate-dependent enzyme [Caldisericota bacterium]
MRGREGEFLDKSFQELLSRHSILGDVRGMGLVWGLEIVEDKKSKKPSPEKARKVVQKAYERGLLMIAPIGMFGNVLRIAPPLSISRKELETGIEIIDSALSETICGK